MFTLLRLATDALFVLLSFIIAYLIKYNALNLSTLFNFPLITYFSQLTFVLIVFLIVFYLVGLYGKRKGFLIEVDEFIGVFLGVTIAWAVIIILTFIKGEYEFSRRLILLSWPITFLSLLISREVILWIEVFFIGKGYGAKRAVVIGQGQLAKEVAERIRAHPSYGIKFVDFVSLAKLGELPEFVKRNQINVLYVADKSINRDKLTEIAAFCDQNGIELGTIADVFDILATSPSVESIEGLAVVSLRQTRFTFINRFLKRTFDILFALFGIVLFAVPMIIIAVLIKAFSPGPAVYTQERVGRRGKVFDLYKFRTMVPDAEAKTGPVLASEDDPRKTPVGKILRTTNLDELPQLFNILKGDMSFVGPRPERPVFVEEFKQIIPKYMERHKISPGLAGWAQLHGGYDMPAEEKIKYDLYYIENWSFLLDIKIILKYIQIAFTFQRTN